MDPTSPFNPPAGTPASKSPKVLWGVIGALAVAVVALGGTLLYRHEAPTAVAPPVAAVAANTNIAPQAPDDFKPEAMPPAPAVPPMAAAPLPAPARAPELQAVHPKSIINQGCHYTIMFLTNIQE